MAQPQEDEAQQQAQNKALMEKKVRAMQIEQQKRSMVKRYLTNEAYERLMNVRMANHDLYTQLTDLLIAMAQNRRIEGQLSEEQLKQILSRMSYKKEPSIEFKHK